MKNEYLDNLFIHTSQNWLLYVYLINKGLTFLRVDFDFPIKKKISVNTIFFYYNGIKYEGKNYFTIY